MRAIVTGATGFIGRRLLRQISDSVVLSRNPAATRKTLGNVEVHGWDPLAGPPPAAAFQGVEAVFHLAGEPIAEGRWNAKKKALIRDSRVIGTANLVRGMEAVGDRPRVLVSGSAVGYYGSRGDEELDETSSPADDFLGQVCREWEQAAAPAAVLGVRVVTSRTGIVLGRGGGALSKMLLPFKLGIGGRLGDGRQWMPWIHLDDLVGLLLHAASNDTVSGPMNSVAPKPVTNREFTKILAATLHRPAVFPVPSFGLHLALGEFAEVLLGSQRVLPCVAQRTGYAFQYPDLAAALQAILKGESSAAIGTGRPNAA